MTFNDFIDKHDLKNRATSNVKKYEKLKKMELDSKVGIIWEMGIFQKNIV